jgi:hypothetical protein
MIISQSNIALSAQSYYREEHIKSESLNAWKDSPAIEKDAVSATAPSISNSSIHASSSVDGDAAYIKPSPQDEMKLQLIRAMYEGITGKEMKLSVVEQSDTLRHSSPSVDTFSQGSVPAEERQGWGMSYRYHESHQIDESMSFSASGVVKTSDGKEIMINMQLNMDRHLYRETNIQLDAGDALIDPLVINFSAPSAELTQRDFIFDLDADGELDQISFVGQGSGFLALDRNGSGTIEDGRELFGTQSGNGFKDLSLYDQDGNGWIDENDSVYNHLRIWSRDQNGEQQLLALGEHNVGAIYLGHLTSPFNITDESGELLGKVQQGGIFLKETGEVGSVQHIDLVV